MVGVSARSTDLSVGQLSRWGFMDASAALASWRNLVDAFPTLEVPILRGMAESADPDSALTGLSRVLERTPDARELIASLLGDAFFTRRLVSVMGASTALADHLARHPGDCFLLADRDVVAMRPTADALRATLLTAVGAAATSEQPRASADAAQATDQLRVAYRRALLSVAARDLTSHLTDPGAEADVVEGGADVADVTDIAAELADLAAAALEAALAIARTEVGKDSLLV